MVRQQRVAAKLTNSLDEASNAAQDQAVKAMEGLAKTSNLLEDALKKEIAAHKQTPKTLVQTMNRIEAIGEKLIDAQASYRKAVNQAKAEVEKHKKVDRNSSQAERQAKAAALRNLRKVNLDQERALQKVFKGLGISVQNAVKSIDQYAAEAVKHKESLKKVDATLSSAGSKIGKSLDQVRSKVVTNIESFGKLSVVVDLARRAVTELYGQGVRLASKGLIGSMAQMNISALKLRMTAEEFESIVGANRDMIAILGGGAQGVEKFERILSDSSVGLEYLGKEGKKAAATIISTFNKAGYGLASTNADVARAFRQNVKDINKQFKLFNGAFGDTAEQFAALYEGQLQSEALQAKLLSADKADYNLQLREIMVRTENLKLMGLSNEQVLAMSKRVDSLFNPKKNRQAEAITQRLYAREAMVQGARGVAKEDEALAARLEDFVRSGDMAKFQGMDQESKKTWMANNPQLMKDVAKMVEIQAKLRDQSGGDTSFSGYVFTDLMEKAGGEFQMMAETGKNLLQANAQGFDQTEAGKKKLAEQAYANTLSDINGKTTLLGQSFGLLRDSVDSVTSVMNNPFTTAIGAVAAGALFMSKTVRGAASSLVGHISNAAKALGGVIGRAGQFVMGTGKMMMSGFVGLFKGIWAFMKKIPGLAIAISALETVVDVARTDTEEYEERLGLEAGDTFLGNVGVRLAGAVTDLGANFAKGLTLGAWDPSKNFADKQRKEREAKEGPKPEPQRPTVATRPPLAVQPASGDQGPGKIAKVLSTAPGMNVVQRDDGSVEQVKGDRNWRNNNPGNLEYNEYTKSLGAIGTDGRFAIFPDYKTGRNAKAELIFNSKNYKDLDLKKAISRYAPSFENDTGAYQKSVLDAVGGLNKRMGDYTFEERAKILDAMQKVEGFKVGSVTKMGGADPNAVVASKVAKIIPPTPPTVDQAMIDKQKAQQPQQPAAAKPIEPTSTKTGQASDSEKQNPVMAELQKQTAILQQIATLTGRSMMSSNRGYQLDQQLAINLGA